MPDINLARQQARESLALSATFANMPKEEQIGIYKDLVAANLEKMAAANGISSALAKPKKASDLIEDARHENRRIEQAGDLAGDFVQNVDFPKFVRDLLKGVFDANLEVTLKQMETYTKLMKAATASISKFINAIDDTAAFGYLAENNGDDFSIDFDDKEKDDSGNSKAVLTDKQGNKLDIGDNEVKAKIMDAKIAMAKEQRALLRETILMGITRLVVERGNVKAACVFDIKATENIVKQDKAALKKSKSTGTSLSGGTGLLGSFVGNLSGGRTSSERETQISVSSAKSTGTTALSASITGSVDITFKSDYFKLDNFAEMYGALKKEEAKPAALPAPAK